MSKRQCSNCLPSRKGSSSNMKPPPVLQTHDTALRAVPASPASPVPPSDRQPCVPSRQAATFTTIPATQTTAPNSTAQTSADPLSPISAHPTAHPTGHAHYAIAQTPPPLPSPVPLPNPSFTWGEIDSASIMESMDLAYAEIVHWRKNTFTVPFGNTGKGFVSELSRLYKAYAERSALEAIALKACTIMPILLSQKPSKIVVHPLTSVQASGLLECVRLQDE